MAASAVKSDQLIWAYLIHLSYNMWSDRPVEGHPYYSYQPYLRVEDDFWNELLPRMRDAGVNMLLIDVGDGVQFESHPEIPVKEAWSKSRR